MLKIYFDWNCITHSKDKYPYILNIAEECGDMFIFPFSNAHLRDILTSHSEENKYFDSDVELLERICGKHYLVFEDNQMLPKFAGPADVIDVCGEELETIQKLEFITPENYTLIKEAIKKQLPPDMLNAIQGAEPEDVISIIDKYISKNWHVQNLESLLSLYQSDMPQLVNAEVRFKSMCLVLDMLGYRPEKKSKQIMNIDTDASHIFYASNCDIFVTADKKLRGKAEAMYKKYHFQTRIFSPTEFKLFINEELRKEYSLQYISNAIDTYGNPRMEDDGAHYKFLPTHIFGMFNTCHKIDKSWGYDGETKVGLFRYSFNNTPYLFYTEITHFCDFIASLIPSDQKEIFQKEYVHPLTSGNYQATMKATYTFDCKELDMSMILSSDPLSPVPVPMMYFIIGSRSEELVGGSQTLT